MRSKSLNTKTPAQLPQGNGNDRIVVGEHRQVHMVAGGEPHPATAGSKLIELEYLAHLENMPQTKRALLIKSAKCIEALEPLAGQGKVVASQILQDE